MEIDSGNSKRSWCMEMGGRSRDGHGPPAPAGDPPRPYGSNPVRRAATTASPRVWAPSFRIAERR